MARTLARPGDRILPAVQVAQILEHGREFTRSLGEEALAAILRGQEDIQPSVPFAAIRQKGTPGTVPGGLKFNDGRPDEPLSLRLIVLGAKLGRVCWDTESLSLPPRCKSIDGRAPLGEMVDPGVRRDGVVASACEHCIRAMWPRERNRLAERLGNPALRHPEKPEAKPECSEVLNLLVCLPDGSDTFILSLHGKSLRPTHNYLGRFKRRQVALFTVVSELSSEFESGEKGDYYVLKWQEAGETPRELAGALVEEYPQLLAMLTRDLEAFDRAIEGELCEVPITEDDYRVAGVFE